MLQRYEADRVEVQPPIEMESATSSTRHAAYWLKRSAYGGARARARAIQSLLMRCPIDIDSRLRSAGIFDSR
jgi:hypothetical protein